MGKIAVSPSAGSAKATANRHYLNLDPKDNAGLSCVSNVLGVT